MDGLTLRQLRYFAALAQHRHFGRAAQDCAISQPALSVQIKDLEETLGAPLVERAGRHTDLTALGEQVAERCTSILRLVEDLGTMARAGKGALSGRLRCGVIPTVAPYFLPKLMTILAQRFPDLDVIPRETRTEQLVTDLRSGRLDVAILAVPLMEPALEEVVLFDEEFLLVRSTQDRDKPVPGPEGLRDMRLLLLEEGHCFRDQALSFCARAGSTPREIMEGSSLTTLVQMVGAGIGVSLVPEMAVPVETRLADVDIVRLPAPRPSRSIGIVWRKSGVMAERYGILGETLSEALRNTGDNRVIK